MRREETHHTRSQRPGGGAGEPKARQGWPKVLPHLPVVYSERADVYSANAIAVWFLTRFREIGIEGASSHSGRRSFITAAAKKITEAGGSLRDIQELVGHSSLATTQRYIQGDTDAKRNVIALI